VVLQWFSSALGKAMQLQNRQHLGSITCQIQLNEVCEKWSWEVNELPQPRVDVGHLLEPGVCLRSGSTIVHLVKDSVFNPRICLTFRFGQKIKVLEEET
jgi:hypothetical protein